ncbi:hypothetical protein [Clostridium paraputrificum]|uniref:Uncharacterized protein n=1 Tax=Clostridium paraputrificum TaxID=29363 RepID=A0A6N3EXI7_9CLOT
MSILWSALFVILSVTIALIVVSSDIYSRHKEEIDKILYDSEKYDPDDDTIGPLEQSRLKICHDNRIVSKIIRFMAIIK